MLGTSFSMQAGLGGNFGSALGSRPVAWGTFASSLLGGFSIIGGFSVTGGFSLGVGFGLGNSPDGALAEGGSFLALASLKLKDLRTSHGGCESPDHRSCVSALSGSTPE